MGKERTSSELSPGGPVEAFSGSEAVVAYRRISSERIPESIVKEYQRKMAMSAKMELAGALGEGIDTPTQFIAKAAIPSAVQKKIGRIKPNNPSLS